MKVMLVFVLGFACVSSTLNFDVFKWPSFRRHYKGEEENGSFMKGIKDMTSKIIEFKKNLFGKKGGGGNNKGVGYPRGPPTKYGEPPSSYRVTYRMPSVTYSAPRPTSYSNFASSYISQSAPPNVVSGNFNVLGTVPTRSLSNRLSPPPLTHQAKDFETNAPLSAVMSMSHLVREEEVNRTPIQMFTGGWVPITRPPTLQRPLAPNFDIRTSPSNPPMRPSPVDSRFNSTGHEVLLINGLHEDKGSMDDAGRALSHLVDTTLLVNPEEEVDEIKQEHLFSVHREKEAELNSVLVSSSVSQRGQINMRFGELMDRLKLNTFMALIRRSNLDSMLTTEGGFTIFAPSDSAFTLLPRSVLLTLQNNTEKLREVVLFHVMPGVAKVEEFANDQLLVTASPKGRKLRVNIYDHGTDIPVLITVNGAVIQQGNMVASNGIVHVIDRVLYPMTDKSILDHLESCDIFTGANVAVTGAAITRVLQQDGPFTFFVPTTAAFATIDNDTVASFIENITMLQEVLMFHIIPGTYYSEGLRDGTYLPTLAQEQELPVQVTTDGFRRRLSGVGSMSKVIKPDIVATNGVIHIIDMVLRPEQEMPLCGYF